MQITSNGGSWSNAGASQQVSSSIANSGKTNGKSSIATAEYQLEHSEKAGDRDAQERYEGQSASGNSASSSENTEGSSEQQNLLIHLPAIEEEPSQLDMKM
jgi:hypothetical protein